MNAPRYAPGSGWVRLRYPTAPKMRPDQLADLCAWELRQHGGEAWVRTDESYRRVDPGLLRLDGLISPSEPPVEHRAGFDALAGLPDQERFLDQPARDIVARRLARNREERTAGGCWTPSP